MVNIKNPAPLVSVRLHILDIGKYLCVLLCVCCVLYVCCLADDRSGDGRGAYHHEVEGGDRPSHGEFEQSERGEDRTRQTKR